MLGAFKLVILGACLFGLARSARSEPSGGARWILERRRGHLDLASDGKYSYKDPDTAKLTDSW